MNVSKCPKCGSDQVLGDQCLKCGVILSKFRSAQAAGGSAPVSFVAAPTPEKQTSGYSIPAEVLRAEERRRKSKLQTNLVTAVVLIALLFCGFATYRYLVRKASRYSGEYRNGNMLFALHFPQQNSRWFHYQKDEWSSPVIQGAGDAFYRGDSPDSPQIVLGAYLSGIRALPERFEPSAAEALKALEEESLLQTLSAREIEATLSESELTQFGGNHGFRMAADIKVQGAPMKLIALRAYNLNNSYWIYIAGTEEMMSRYGDEIRKIEESLGFNVSAF